MVIDEGKLCLRKKMQAAKLQQGYQHPGFVSLWSISENLIALFFTLNLMSMDSRNLLQIHFKRQCCCYFNTPPIGGASSCKVLKMKCFMVWISKYFFTDGKKAQKEWKTRYNETRITIVLHGMRKYFQVGNSSVSVAWFVEAAVQL